MPRTIWRRRPTSDSPRPAGRRWSGPLRRGGVLARRVLLVPGGRQRRARPVTGHPGPVVPQPQSPVSEPQLRQPQLPPPAGDAAAPAAAPQRLLPGEATLSRRVRFALVNLCTLGSLALGVMAILLAMRGDVQLAALALIACVAIDGLDGLLARRLGVSSPFGAQMDSLADMCSFGIAAPVVVYASLAGTVPPAAAGVACALVAGCAAVRLARFNVSSRNGRFFSGVPTTTVAAVLALIVLLDLPLSAGAQLVGVALLAFAMVSSFPYATVARLVRLPVWLWLLPVGGALINAQATFAVLVAVYLASGPVLWLHQRRRPPAAAA